MNNKTVIDKSELTDDENITECALTTIDNPYDPFDEFIEWFLFDETHGYGTCSYLARIARTTTSYPEKVNEMEIERAIDEILQFDFQGIYKKVKKGDKIVVTKIQENSDSVDKEKTNN